MVGFQDVLKKSFVEGFTANSMPTGKILVILLVTLCIGVYIYFIYKLVNKSSLYDRSFHIAMTMISVITAGIIVAMQSSIVISLGMVGALSIVRFRTAVKDAMDLLFLFWSIGEGIICGAGLFEVGVLVALLMTAGIFALEFLPRNKKPYLLVLQSTSLEKEEEILACVKGFTKSLQVKSRNLKKSGCDYILEVRTEKERELLMELGKMDTIVHMTLMTHEGEVRF